MMTTASDDLTSLDPAHNVVVADGAAVIHSDRPLSKCEQNAIRNHYRTMADVHAGIAMGKAMNEAIVGFSKAFDTKIIEGSDA